MAILVQYCVCSCCKVRFDWSRRDYAHCKTFFLASSIDTSWSSCPWRPATHLLSPPSSQRNLLTSPVRKETMSCLPSMPAANTSPRERWFWLSTLASQRSLWPAAFPSRTSDNYSSRLERVSFARATFSWILCFKSNFASMSCRIAPNEIWMFDKWSAPCFKFCSATLTSYSRVPSVLW